MMVVSNKDTDSKGKKIGYSILFGFIIIYFAFLVGGMTHFMYGSLKEANLDLLIPGIFMVGASFMILTTCFFSAHGYLFGAKDLDMLFSFPISHRDIFISKFLMLYFYDLMFSMIIFGVSGVVYCVESSAGLMGWLVIIIGTFILPFLPLTVGVLISYLVGLALRRVKQRKAITTIMAVAVSVAIIIFFNMTSLQQYIVEHSADIFKAIKSYYPPAGLLVKAIDGDILSFLLFAVINILPMVILLPLLSTRFASIVAAYASSSAKADYKFRSQKQAKKIDTCFRKEFKKIFSSPVYILNCGVGIIMLLVFSISLFQGAGSNGFSFTFAGAEYAPLVAMFAIMVCCTMVSTTCCTFSLEAKTFWIYKTAPVDEKTVFEAKALANEMLYIPFIVIFGIIYAFLLKMDMIDLILVMLVPIVGVICSSYFGLIVNLAFPKMNWKNETQVIKQSASVMLSMFVSIGFNTLIIILSVVALSNLSISITEVMLCLLVIYLLIMVLLEYCLRTWGVKKYRKLY